MKLNSSLCLRIMSFEELFCVCICLCLHVRNHTLADVC